MDLCNQSDDSSDDENIAYLTASGILPGFENNGRSRQRRGSIPNKRPNKRRNFEEAARRLHQDYFSSHAKYSPTDFERRFRMPRLVFDLIFEAVEGRGIFVHRVGTNRKKGIYPIQRVTAAIRMLEDGIAADALDKYLQMSEDSVLLSLK